MYIPDDDLPAVTLIPESDGLSEEPAFMNVDDMKSVRSLTVRVFPAVMLLPKSELRTHFSVEAFHVAEMSTWSPDTPILNVCFLTASVSSAFTAVRISPSLRFFPAFAPKLLDVTRVPCVPTCILNEPEMFRGSSAVSVSVRMFTSTSSRLASVSAPNIPL